MTVFLKKFLPQRVKSKLLFLVGGLIAVLIVIPVVLQYTESMHRAREEGKMQAGELATRATDQLQETEKELLLVAQTVAHMPAATRYLAERDRPALLALCMPLFKQLKEHMELNVFHFHLPPAISFLRLQKPEKYGDDLSGFRKTVVDVNRTLEPVSAIEVGRAGMSVRAVVPVMYTAPGEDQERHVGSVEFGAPLKQAFVDSVKKLTGSNVALIVPDGEGFKVQAATYDPDLSSSQAGELRRVMASRKMATVQGNLQGHEVMVAYRPVTDYSGKAVGVLAVPFDISATLHQAHRRALYTIAAGFAAILLVQGLIWLLFNRLINRPLDALTRRLEKASQGDLTQTMDASHIEGVNCSELQACDQPDCSMYGKTGYCWEEAGSLANNIQCPQILSGELESCSQCGRVFGSTVKDEFSELTVYFNGFLANVTRMVKEIRDNSENLNETSAALGSVSTQLDASTAETAGRVESVAAAAEEMSANMASVAAATEEAAANVNVMSTAAEEIGSTIGEIQQNTANAKQITGQAVEEASDISTKVDELGNAAQDIGKVTETITEISAQTNLLALNATIEAARAGEAGKGFAVVANEIKDLARQTADATGEIKKRIEGIQHSTGITVDGIRKITDIIKEIDEIVTFIAGAIDEQGATMTELTSNVQQAGQGISEVSENVAQSSEVSREIADDVSQVNAATEQVAKGSRQVHDRAGELQQLAGDLKEMIDKFKLN